MIIKEIELANIRSHKNTIISFDKGITVLSGRTGCGKSTFFIALAYALFGADVNLNNKSILRRGASKGYVKFSFINKGVECEIMRGLKRSGDKIITNPDELWIKEDSKIIPIIERSNEVNEHIIELLGYPADIKPKELFEITCYAKQDEIRKLIELTSGEREKYIDRVLQLSKYELTYENMRSLINDLNNKASMMRGQVESLNKFSDSITSKESELKSLKESLSNVSSELINSDECYKKIKSDYDSIKSRINDLELKKAVHDRKKGLIEGMIKERASIDLELKSISGLPDKSCFEELISEQAEINQELKQLRIMISNLEEESININNLKGSCPLCKQLITKEHADKVVNKIKSELESIRNKESSLINELDSLKERLINERRIKELIELSKNKQQRLIELNKKIDEASEELESLNVDELNNLKDEFSKINDLFIKQSSVNSALTENKRNIESNINRLTNELTKLKSELDLLKSISIELNTLDNKIKLLNKLREDIRSIRSVVRSRFLEDFRHEFQKKYEDIRQDDSYSVDINTNYEPIAFAGNEETSISSLSGGEKTSVALAYRLALSEMAARLSSVDHSEVLLLDEPTTGFDRRDVNALPKALRAIKTIPQIIIVSHEDELKEAADIKFELVKDNGITRIN